MRKQSKSKGLFGSTPDKVRFAGKCGSIVVRTFVNLIMTHQKHRSPGHDRACRRHRHVLHRVARTERHRAGCDDTAPAVDTAPPPAVADPVAPAPVADTVTEIPAAADPLAAKATKVSDPQSYDQSDNREDDRSAFTPGGNTCRPSRSHGRSRACDRRSGCRSAGRAAVGAADSNCC